MGRAFGILLIVVGVWIGLELQTKGTQGAFGGKLAGLTRPLESVRGEPVMPRSPITEQVRDQVTGVMEQYERDRARQTGTR